MAVGRQLCSDGEACARGFRGTSSATRRRILRETIAAFEQCDPPDRYHRLASANLQRWHSEGHPVTPDRAVQVIAGDWGTVTHSLTKKYGTCFAVLNMANAYVPGGAYVEGAVAQEENMFRRTDCHFQVTSQEFDSASERYRADVTKLLSAHEGRVYLDVHKPRVCIRGPENRAVDDLGYGWLPDEEVFPFYELRAAAQDLRDGRDFDEGDGRKRIAAQLDTLRAHELRHAVLGAFGCGAFRNPATTVARLYKEEVAMRHQCFALIAFAIFDAGYGPDNFAPFASEFETGKGGSAMPPNNR